MSQIVRESSLFPYLTTNAKPSPRLLAVRPGDCSVFLLVDRIDPEEQQRYLKLQVYTRGLNVIVIVVQGCHHSEYSHHDLARCDNHCTWRFNAVQVWAMRRERLGRPNCLPNREHLLHG